MSLVFGALIGVTSLDCVTIDSVVLSFNQHQSEADRKTERQTDGDGTAITQHYCSVLKLLCNETAIIRVVTGACCVSTAGRRSSLRVNNELMREVCGHCTRKTTITTVLNEPNRQYGDWRWLLGNDELWRLLSAAAPSVYVKNRRCLRVRMVVMGRFVYLYCFLSWDDSFTSRGKLLAAGRSCNVLNDGFRNWTAAKLHTVHASY